MAESHTKFRYAKMQPRIPECKVKSKQHVTWVLWRLNRLAVGNCTFHVHNIPSTADSHQSPNTESSRGSGNCESELAKSRATAELLSLEQRNTFLFYALIEHLSQWAQTTRPCGAKSSHNSAYILILGEVFVIRCIRCREAPLSLFAFDQPAIGS